MRDLYLLHALVMSAFLVTWYIDAHRRAGPLTMRRLEFASLLAVAAIHAWQASWAAGAVGDDPLLAVIVSATMSLVGAACGLLVGWLLWPLCVLVVSSWVARRNRRR